MKRLIVYATVMSGVLAAYLMYRRGESLGTILTKTAANPLGTFVTEVGNVMHS